MALAQGRRQYPRTYLSVPAPAADGPVAPDEAAQESLMLLSPSKKLEEAGESHACERTNKHNTHDG